MSLLKSKISACGYLRAALAKVQTSIIFSSKTIAPSFKILKFSSQTRTHFTLKILIVFLI